MAWKIEDIIGEATRFDLIPRIDVSGGGQPQPHIHLTLGGCQSCGSSKVLTVTHFDLLDDTKDPWRDDDRQFMKSGEGGACILLKSKQREKIS